MHSGTESLSMEYPSSLLTTRCRLWLGKQNANINFQKQISESPTAIRRGIGDSEKYFLIQNSDHSIQILAFHDACKTDSICCVIGDWFCSGKCKDIHHALRERVEQGAVDLGDDYQWQLLHGKDGTTSTTWQLKGCQDILEESFDPIIDQISKQNLVKGMVYSEQQGEWDHSGMFAAVLKYKVE